MPDDCEVSLGDVRAAVSAARRFRGSDGARQRLVVTSVKVSVPCKVCQKEMNLECEEKRILRELLRMKTMKGDLAGALVCKCPSKKCGFHFSVDGDGIVAKLLKHLWHQKKKELRIQKKTVVPCQLIFQHLAIYLTVMFRRLSDVHFTC